MQHNRCASVLCQIQDMMRIVLKWQKQSFHPIFKLCRFDVMFLKGIFQVVCELCFLDSIHLQCYFSCITWKNDVDVSFAGSGLLHECKFLIWCFLIWDGGKHYGIRLAIIYIFLIVNIPWKDQNQCVSPFHKTLWSHSPVYDTQLLNPFPTEDK